MLQSSLLSSAVWYPFRVEDSPLGILRFTAFWATVLFLVLGVVCALILSREDRAAFGRAYFVGAIFAAAALGILFLVVTFLEDGIALILFAPLLTLILAAIVAAVLLLIRRNLATKILAGILVGGAFIAAVVCVGLHFASGESLEWNGIGNGDVSELGLYLSAALFLALLAAAAFWFGRKDKKGFDSRSIAYAAVCIAMSFALSYLRIVKMPQGGSITVASLLPLMLYSYMFGTKKGVFAGMIYGILQAFQDLYILHPAQFILDYPAAFACIGLAGMFAKCKSLEKLPPLQFALGAVVAGLLRFVAHFLSGCFAFGAFAPEGTPVWIYSLTYQAGYVLPDIAIVVAVGIFLFCSRSFVKTVRRVNR